MKRTWILAFAVAAIGFMAAPAPAQEVIKTPPTKVISKTEGAPVEYVPMVERRGLFGRRQVTVMRPASYSTMPATTTPAVTTPGVTRIDGTPVEGTTVERRGLFGRRTVVVGTPTTYSKTPIETTTPSTKVEPATYIQPYPVENRAMDYRPGLFPRLRSRFGRY